METNKQSTESSSLKIGLLTSAALIGYFLLMKAVGLAHIIELRLLNFVFLGIGITYGIYQLKKSLSHEDFYLKGLGHGFMIVLFALVPFAIFMTVYLQFIDPQLMAQIRESVAIREYINWMAILFVILLEGLASGAILTFAAMQYFKNEGSKSAKRLSKSH